jgi:hypothetical protein
LLQRNGYLVVIAMAAEAFERRGGLTGQRFEECLFFGTEVVRFGEGERERAHRLGAREHGDDHPGLALGAGSRDSGSLGRYVMRQLAGRRDEQGRSALQGHCGQRLLVEGPLGHKAGHGSLVPTKGAYEAQSAPDGIDQAEAPAARSHARPGTGEDSRCHLFVAFAGGEPGGGLLQADGQFRRTAGRFARSFARQVLAEDAGQSTREGPFSHVVQVTARVGDGEEPKQVIARRQGHHVKGALTRVPTP